MGQITAAVLTIADNDDVGLDFGDAPEQLGDSPAYATLLASNGARHVVTPGLQLGSLVDVDPDGLPTTAADGDDSAGDDDEDGINGLAAPLVENTTRQLDLVVQVPAEQEVGLLNAWIDFNADGRWTAGEQIFDNVVLESGQHRLSFSVPSVVVAGPSYARFRFSSHASLMPTGLAPDGEVEDYRVTLEDSAAGPPWQNPRDPFDVNDDGLYTAQADVLPMINEINQRTIIDDDGNLPVPPVPPRTPPPYYDISGDNVLTAVQDILPLINLLNSLSGSEGEAPQNGFNVTNYWPSTSSRTVATTPLRPADVDAAFSSGIRDEFIGKPSIDLSAIRPLSEGMVKRQAEADDLESLIDVLTENETE